MPDKSENDKKYDFFGIATAYNVLCDDGWTIAHGAFAHQSGMTVPLLWRHKREEMKNVLGHATLEETPKGVRVKARFNPTESGQHAKELVHSKDIKCLSIYANALTRDGASITHGTIREVSLVLSGMNPGASIYEIITHGDGLIDDDLIDDDAVIITSGELIEIVHENAEDTRSVGDVIMSMSDKKQALLALILKSKFEGNTAIESGALESSGEDGESVSDILASFTEEENNILYYLLDQADALEQDAMVHQSESEEDMPEKDQKEPVVVHSIFEPHRQVTPRASMDTQRAILHDAFKTGARSLKDFVIQHAGTYGIDNIDLLFPEAQQINGNVPQMYTRRMEWVAKWMNRVHKSPFSRVKTVYADLTPDSARALGYVTGDLKVEEVFALLSRETTPQTIYKKQKLDRDDVLDITDFDIVTWLKGEMRIMMDEELARAALIGDGRSAVATDKIKDANVRPIWTDADLYVHKILFANADTLTDFLDQMISAREHYRGSGSPVLYIASEYFWSIMVMRDLDGRKLFKNVDDLKAELMVDDVVEVPLMNSQTRDGATNVQKLVGIMVNPMDYTFGSDKGGGLTMFDDFDIDYNQHKYLLETRVSGALAMPKAALVFEWDTGNPI